MARDLLSLHPTTTSSFRPKASQSEAEAEKPAVKHCIESATHAVRIANRILGELDLKTHPDKTFIGRIEHGFTFLSIQFP